MEDDRVAILEAQLSQAKLIAEESDKKYEEVNKTRLTVAMVLPLRDPLEPFLLKEGEATMELSAVCLYAQAFSDTRSF